MRCTDKVCRTVLCLTLILAFMGCGQGGSTPTTSIPSAANGGDENAARGNVAQPVQLTADPNPGASPALPKVNLSPEVLIQTSVGDIKLRLNAELSPVTVDNFLSNYAEKGFYAGTAFHHVENGFMVAAGGFDELLAPRKVHTPIRNEAHNGLRNKKGTVAMARHPDAAHSATSQFFFNLVDNPTLDFKNRESEEDYGYCVFGEVIEGWNVIEQIAAAPVRPQGDFPMVPTTPIIIKSVQRLN